MYTNTWRCIAVVLGCVGLSLGMFALAGAQSAWEIFTDGFESGDVSRWETAGGNCTVSSSAARTGQWGLEASVSDGELYCYNNTLDEIFDAESSFSFDFDPNGVSIPAIGNWPPGKSIQIATLFSSAPRKVMAALYVRESGAGSYLGHLAWEEADGMHYNYAAQEFALPDSWSRITMALHLDSWIKVWVDGAPASEITGIDHAGADVQTAAIGKIWATTNGPSGAVRFDNALVELPRIDDLWVNAAQTDCAARGGLTRTEAFCTIQEAADLAGPGTEVHILDGTYNEHVTPSYSGENEGEYTIYQAETAGSVTIDGWGLACDGVKGVLEILGSGALKKYIKFIGLSVENPITSAGCDRDGIYIKGGQDIIVSGASVTDSSGLAPVNADSVGVYITDSKNITVKDCAIRNTRSSAIRFRDSTGVVIDGNDVTMAVNGGEGECVVAAMGATRFEIMNNTIHDGSQLAIGGAGIDVKNGASYGSVHDNHIHDMPGETFIYVDGFEHGVHNVEVYGNFVECFPDGENGIALSSEQGGLLTGIGVYNNVVSDCSGSGIWVTDWADDGMKTDLRIQNNTVHNNGIGWGGGIWVGSDQIQNVVISNNIVSENRRWQIGVQFPGVLSEVSGSHNLVDGDLDEGVPYTEDCDGNACYEFAGDSRIVGSPDFVNATQGSYDFSLVVGSPAIDSGTTVLVDPDLDGSLEALPFDYDGIERPLDGDMDQLAVLDRGAHEFILYVDVEWTGASDDDWNTQSNWSPAWVPGDYTRVSISDVSGASGRFPVAAFTPPQGANVIDVGPNAFLTIDSNTSLSVLNALTTSGRVEISGTLVLE